MAIGRNEACRDCENGDHEKHAERNVYQEGEYFGDEIICICTQQSA